MQVGRKRLGVEVFGFRLLRVSLFSFSLGRFGVLHQVCCVRLDG